MISCGEASGDLYAGAVTTELRKRMPGVEVTGLGGQRLKEAGASLVGNFSGLTVTGLTEAVRVLPRSYGMYTRLIADARARKPDVFVAIDFPDFNFRLMAAVHRLGVPVVYYVSPQLWAWRTGRMETMKRLVRKVLVIFPFEKPLYERAGVPVEFVGHPLVDLAQVTQTRSALLQQHGLSVEAPTVALLPGSRPNEIDRIAPVILESLPRIRARLPHVQFLVAAAPNLPEESFQPFKSAGPAIRVVQGQTDNVLAASDAVITASGTATVQAALHERPMVVVYRLSPLTYRLGLPFVKVNTYAMPNLVAGERVVPELIQSGFTATRTADETIALLTDSALNARTRAALRTVRERLGAPGASRRAAEAILDVAARSTRGLTPA
jgi:lipid-A-disaccharide synthase